ncbi:MAG TPA: M1 family metallopeptidase [Aggregatilineales bacterium]|nr:M1 family metallopeptidase [Aggregatilineales bacterium]
MTNLKIPRSVYVYGCAILLLALGLTSPSLKVAPRVSAQALATTAPTSSPTQENTAVTAPIVLPAVNWQDVSDYRQAMKPAFADDVQKFVDGNRYLIVATLTLDDQAATIHGAEHVRYTNHTADSLNSVVFRLYPNSPMLDGKMTVADVTANGESVQPGFSGQDSVMLIPLAKPVAPNDSVEMTMNFDLVMEVNVDVSYGRFGYKENVVSGTAWYPTLSVYDKGQGWWTSMPDPKGDPAYSESGLYDVRLTIPAKMPIVMTGKEISTTTNTDGSVTHRNVTGPVRDFAFMTSQRYTIDTEMVDGVEVRVVHYSDDNGNPPALDGTSSALQFVRNAFSTYDALFGEYPFAQFNVVENPTPSGVEYPGLIQVSEQAWQAGQSYLEIVISHETGHQWFYSLIGNNQVEHPWLDESLASYVEIVYTREVKHDPTITAAYVKRFTDRYQGYLRLGGADLALDLPVSSYSGVGYGAIVYSKGPLFYTLLEQRLGVQTVYKALNTYFHRYEYAVATSADVEKVFEEVSGQDLTTLFQQEVYETTSTATAAAP